MQSKTSKEIERTKKWGTFQKNSVDRESLTSSLQN